MRILYIITSLGIGGEQTVTKILLKSFINENNKVDLISLQKSKNIIDYNFTNYYFIKKRKILKNIMRVIQLRKIFKQNSYDVIIAFATIPSILCSIAKIGGTKTPLIITERNDPKAYPFHWKIVRLISYKFANAAVFQTEDASKYFKKKYFKYRKIIPNPVEQNNNQFLNINKLPLIINTSRLTKVKNHAMLIKAFNLIKDDFPNYYILIYGDGPKKKFITKLISTLNLNERVFIKKSIPNIQKELIKAKIFVLTSNREGMPNSLIEAMSLGIPVIATDCRIGGPRFLIQNGVNGFLIKTNDEVELASKISILLKNSKIRKKFSFNAKNIAIKLNVNTITKEWLEFISYVINNN